MTYRSTRHLPVGEMIADVNTVLRGWANYYRYGVSKAVFGAVDRHTSRLCHSGHMSGLFLPVKMSVMR
jgi:Group II intron, maturase-specific domain